MNPPPPLVTSKENKNKNKQTYNFQSLPEMGVKDRTRVKTKTNQERNYMTHIWYLLNLKWNARSQSVNSLLSFHQDVVQNVLKFGDNDPIISS